MHRDISGHFLLDNPNVTLQTITALSLATLLQDSERGSDLQHDCLDIIYQVYSSRQDLLEQLLTEHDWELYADGSSFIETGQ